MEPLKNSAAQREAGRSRTTQTHARTRMETDNERVDRAITIECGNLDVFLQVPGRSTTVLLMPLHRTVWAESGSWYQHWCVHLTSCGLERDHLYYATFWAAEVSGAGELGCLTYPERQREPANTVAVVRAQQLAQELLACVMEVVNAHESVHHLLSPARYGPLPIRRVWGLQSALVPHICYRDGRWQPLPPSSPCTSASVEVLS